MRIIFAIALVAVFALPLREFVNPITLKLPKLQKGDVILRQGIGRDSLAIQHFSNSKFSHIGMVVDVNPTLIIHATTDDKGRDEVIFSTFGEFLEKSREILIKRYELSKEQQERITSKIKSYLGEKFALSNDKESLYCTTLLYKSMRPFMQINLQYEFINAPFLGGWYLLPKAFEKDLDSKVIFRASVNDGIKIADSGD